MKLHLERETTYVPVQCPVTKRWSNSKLEFTGNWTVYRDSSYPVFTGTKREAEKFIEENS